jgi:hypothetical protein
MTGSMTKTMTAFILAVAEEYRRVSGYKLSSVGIYALKDATYFQELAKGVRTRTSLEQIDKAMAWFTANWPPGAQMPPPPPWPYSRKNPAPATAAGARVQRIRGKRKAK